ncbi:unnamed protein product [Paramecium pentaurelia]|uniref:Uncharacterized protein n=1 Tax=Paramecium pentaurelia TaxID=43138 RepID=A0A8S1XAY8_9CILI|nr:unnamed protein product [Paramecium pentaurelia]
MILIITLVQISNQNLIYQFDASAQVKDDWQGLSTFLKCGNIFYFGQAETHQISRVFFDLKSHQQYRIDAEILSIDGYIVPKFFIENNLESQDSESPPQEIQVCGGLNMEYFKTITIIRKHNRRNFWMRIELGQGGLLRLKLSIISCQYGCIGCIQIHPISCLNWKLHEYSFQNKLITIQDGWSFTLDVYQDFYCGYCQYLKFTIINYSTQLPPHQDLLIRFYKRDNGIIILDYKYGIQKTTNEYYHLVEILITNHQDPILQLSFRTQNPELKSLIRDFELFYTEPEIKFPNFSQGCIDLKGDQCFRCQKGWIQDEYFKNCHPICGDKIIQGQEECDDGNQIDKDGCFQCRFSCIDFCITCLFGICYECEDGFIINNNHTCDPKCGDGILIPYSGEQCDFREDEIQSGCENCRYIAVSNCKASYFTQCLECEQGFYSLGQACYPYCGDRIVQEQFEDCDDGNLEPFDGCYECQFQCIEGCDICDQGQCLLKCGNEYEFVNNACHSICGDQIVTQEEECDDGNNIQFDGCFNCKFSCPFHCDDCYQGICLQFNNQYQLLNLNQYKQQLNCGDGLLQEQEQCDDGNDQIADGCSNECVIEQNWICQTILKDSPTQCSFVRSPKLIINYLNMTYNKQYISIIQEKMEWQLTHIIRCWIIYQLRRICFGNRNTLITLVQASFKNLRKSDSSQF